MKLEIRKNVFLKDRYFLLELAAPSAVKAASPGQFLHMRMEDSCDPFLRRPFSIHDVVKNHRKGSCVIKILYEVVGKGTGLLSQKKALTEVDALGPLGRGFDLKTIAPHEKIYIVAGGMGVAPLFFLAKRLTEVRSQKSEVRKTVVLLGAKTKNHILCEKEFKNLGCDVQIATEDGSKGFKGRVTGLFKEILLRAKSPASPAGRHEPSTICACGPKAMLAVISEIAHLHRVRAHVSLEEFMGCGLGVCLGCTTRTTSGYKRICHDGPVFSAEEIIWEANS